MTKKFIYIGYDSPHPQPFQVASYSALRSLGHSTPFRRVAGLHLWDLAKRGVYTRPTNRDDRSLVDLISDAPMSTEFALSRFLVPHLAGESGLALFMDCDMLVRGNILEVFAIAKADPSKAVWVVKHDVRQPEPNWDQQCLGVLPGETKMGGLPQSWYARKLWSSFMLFNLAHPSCRALTADRVNNVRGLYLHQLQWAEDDEIGELPAAWNWLVGMQPEPEGGAKLVHWTLGGPWLPGSDCAGLPYEEEWNQTLIDSVNDPGLTRLK